MLKETAAIVLLLVVLSGADSPAEPKDQREAYRFVVQSEGREQVAFRGLITVDGKDRLLERETTPFEFRCEAGSTIAGYFEILDSGQRLRLEVFDPGYSNRRPAALAKRFDRVRFSWAQPGAGPRCLDGGTGACPDTIPSMDEFERRLRSMRKQPANTRLKLTVRPVTALAAARPAPGRPAT